MLPLLPVLVGILGVATIIVVKYWKQIVDWLCDIIPKVKQLFKEIYKNIKNAAAMFVQKVKSSVARIIHRIYFRENGKWMQETRAQEVEEDQVPAWVRRKLKTEENEATEEFEENLKLELN